MPNTNPNISKLDASQVAIRMYDPTNDAQRVVIAAASETQIAISREDNDSVYSYAPQVVLTGTQTPASTGILIAATDLTGYTKFQVYSSAAAGVTVAGDIKVEVSPQSTPTFYVQVGSNFTSGTASGTTISSIQEVLAVKIRVSTVTAPTGGNVTWYIVASR